MLMPTTSTAVHTAPSAKTCARPAPTSHPLTGPIDKPGLHNVFRLTSELYSGSQPEGDAGFQSLEELGVGQGPLGEDAARAVWRRLCERWDLFRGTPVRFWLEAEGTYCLALDHEKRPASEKGRPTATKIAAEKAAIAKAEAAARAAAQAAAPSPFRPFARPSVVPPPVSKPAVPAKPAPKPVVKAPAKSAEKPAAKPAKAKPAKPAAKSSKSAPKGKSSKR